MHALFVNFAVPEKTPHEVIDLFTPLVPAFANLPGNLAKIWLADTDTDTGRYGALYLWHDREDMDAFIASDLWRSVQDHPALTDFEIRHFAVIEPFTKATQPALTIV
jgi:heme-degrading monooxygenase HmoA